MRNVFDINDNTPLFDTCCNFKLLSINEHVGEVESIEHNDICVINDYAMFRKFMINNDLISCEFINPLIIDGTNTYAIDLFGHELRCDNDIRLNLNNNHVKNLFINHNEEYDYVVIANDDNSILEDSYIDADVLMFKNRFILNYTSKIKTSVLSCLISNDELDKKISKLLFGKKEKTLFDKLKFIDEHKFDKNLQELCKKEGIKNLKLSNTIEISRKEYDKIVDLLNIKNIQFSNLLISYLGYEIFINPLD